MLFIKIMFTVFPCSKQVSEQQQHTNQKCFLNLFSTTKSGRLGTACGSTPFPSGMAVVLKASSEPLRKDAAECSGQLRAGFRPRLRTTPPAPAAERRRLAPVLHDLCRAGFLARIFAYLVLEKRPPTHPCGFGATGGWVWASICFAGRLGTTCGSTPFPSGMAVVLTSSSEPAERCRRVLRLASC